jgi:hypothetical protein
MTLSGGPDLPGQPSHDAIPISANRARSIGAHALNLGSGKAELITILVRSGLPRILALERRGSYSHRDRCSIMAPTGDWRQDRLSFESHSSCAQRQAALRCISRGDARRCSVPAHHQIAHQRIPRCSRGRRYDKNGANQPLSKSTIGHGLCELDMRQALRDLDGTDIPTSRHRPATAFRPPIDERIS